MRQQILLAIAGAALALAAQVPHRAPRHHQVVQEDDDASDSAMYTGAQVLLQAQSSNASKPLWEYSDQELANMTLAGQPLTLQTLQDVASMKGLNPKGNLIEA